MQVNVTADDSVYTELAALHRAVPMSRMLDYGMHADDAACMSALGAADMHWPRAAERLAESRLKFARAMAIGPTRAEEIENAAAAFNVAQLAFGKDVPAKIDLYRRAGKALDEACQDSSQGSTRFELSHQGRTLYGRELTVTAPVGCVVIIGGLSGWGASYLKIAKALRAVGISTLMVEGPGQGATRMESGLYLSFENLRYVQAFVDLAHTRAPRVGILGNSFGGLIAAHLSAATSRISACCINGAAPRIEVPEFRTIREQMEAAFGCHGSDLAGRLAALEFNRASTPLRCPALLLAGGRDPVVAPEVQDDFLGPHPPAGSETRLWPDGEHTLYNHAEERNDVLAHWFHLRFAQPPGIVAGAA